MDVRSDPQDVALFDVIRLAHGRDGMGAQLARNTGVRKLA
jgi:hypothetical protein